MRHMDISITASTISRSIKYLMQFLQLNYANASDSQDATSVHFPGKNVPSYVKKHAVSPALAHQTVPSLTVAVNQYAKMDP